MPKVSPAKLNFNAGEFAITVEGRTDLDRHPSSMRVMRNCIAAPQGPCIRRSGTYFTGNAYRHDMVSGLIAFVFSDEQAQMLEFANNRLRFMTEDGFQIYTPVSLTAVVTASPFKFTSAALGANIGDEVIIDGFAANLNVNGEVGKITAKSGNDYTVDIPYTGTTGAKVGVTVARLYHIDTTYLAADVRNIVAVQDVDKLYLFCKGYRVRILSRNGAYDWQLTTMQFVDGPFEPEDFDYPTLTPSTRGLATGDHTSNTAASPDTGDITFSAEADGSNHRGWHAFDNDPDTYWQGGFQSAWINYEFAVDTIIEGYVIYAARKNVNNNTSAALDNAPSTWKLEGRTPGVDTLDERIEYPSWKNLRTQYIKMNNKTAYESYRLDIQSVQTTGNQSPNVMQIVFRKAGDVFINFTASGTTNINKGQGFLSTDVGRLLRLYQGDGFWRSVEITTVTDSTHITAKLQGEPLYDVEPIRRWRIGSFSDTTGWPSVGSFFKDRLAVGGVDEYPTLLALSAIGKYTTYSPTDPDGTVIDDNGISVKLNARKATPVRWLVGSDRGLLIGTGDSEWILGPDTDNQPFSARNIKADKMTARGSASIQPAEIDKQVIFVHALRRTVREYTYSYEADGYKSPSMSLFAPHLGVPLFAQLAYAAEPHSIVWFRRDDGSIAGMTYQKDESIVGWHQQHFGGVVESVAVIPSTVDAQDTLWMVIRRTVNDQTKRYIERLMRFWDYDSTLETSHYVDCGLRIENPTTNILYGLKHLEGKAVCGMVNNIPFGVAETVTVTNGAITVPLPDEKMENYAIVGLPYESYAETNRIEGGAADGTSQGKTKRMNLVVPFLWQSARGEVGTYNEDQKQDEFDELTYGSDGLELDEAVVLFDGMLDPLTLPPGYGQRGTLIFRQRWPLPFNVIALMPQMTTQDR